jgi:PadR family transcriptional regulator, regulatory protein PadR
MKPDAVRGHLDGLILSVLEDGPRHGYAIIEALQARSGGRLDLPTGTVYPALRRLERAGLLSGTWSTVGGRERRTYTLTRAGRHALAGQRADWTEFSALVNAVLRPAAGTSLPPPSTRSARTSPSSTACCTDPAP